MYGLDFDYATSESDHEIKKELAGICSNDRDNIMTKGKWLLLNSLGQICLYLFRP